MIIFKNEPTFRQFRVSSQSPDLDSPVRKCPVEVPGLPGNFFAQAEVEQSRHDETLQPETLPVSGGLCAFSSKNIWSTGLVLVYQMMGSSL